eukprot:3436002-Prymnesium_polylepis.1
MSNLGPGALDFGDYLDNWVPGDWFVHFPGSSMPSHVPYKRCFEAFQHAVDPTASLRDEQTRYVLPAACDAQRSLSQKSPLSAFPNCSLFRYPKQTYRPARNESMHPSTWKRWNTATEHEPLPSAF